MVKSLDSRQVAELMLSWLDLELVSCTELQRLWAGYGSICAVEARPKSKEALSRLRQDLRDGVYCAERGVFRLVLKFISPPNVDFDDEGHLRKILSYEVEQYFYEEVAPRLDSHTAVAKCMASTRGFRSNAEAAGLQGVTATILNDLRPEFPVAGEKRATLNTEQVSAALSWLAHFHRSYWSSPTPRFDHLLMPPLEESKRRKMNGEAAGNALWLNGGYTYLATRRKEYDYLADDGYSEWSSAFCAPVATGRKESTAEVVASFLTPKGRDFETYIHGDVKSENLFSKDTGDQVAFFDFQYVGMGLGVCDLAKLFTCSVPLDMLVGSTIVGHSLSMMDGEEQLLEQYRELLLKSQANVPHPEYSWEVFVRHWECALVDWSRFQASWGWWGNTEWLQARTRSILADEGWRRWLLESTA